MESARTVKASYAFTGRGIEVDKTLLLNESEQNILQGRVSVAYHRPAWLSALGYVRLTSERVCVAMLAGNRIIEIPKSAFLSCGLETPWWGALASGLRTGPPILRISYQMEGGADRISLMKGGTAEPHGRCTRWDQEDVRG